MKKSRVLEDGELDDSPPIRIKQEKRNDKAHENKRDQESRSPTTGYVNQRYRTRSEERFTRYFEHETNEAGPSGYDGEREMERELRREREREETDWARSERQRLTERRGEIRTRDRRNNHDQLFERRNDGRTAWKAGGNWHDSSESPERVQDFERQRFREPSGIATMRIHKVDPYPKDLRTSMKFEAWEDWKLNFEMATERANIRDQRKKAVELMLHAGDEIRKIVLANDLMPGIDEVSPEYRFYSKLVEGVTKHFRGLTDRTVDLNAFDNAHQEETESAVDFVFRLKMLAKRIGVSDKDMIRARFVGGMKDKELKARVFVDGTTLDEVVMMATRKESLQTKQDNYTPWETAQAPVVVAAIDRYKGRDSNKYQATRRGNDRSFQPYRTQAPRFRDSGYRFSTEEGSNGINTKTRDERRCQWCGVMKHKYGSCPAKNAECHECHRVGHFAHMCPKRIRAISVGGSNENNKEV